ncbi:MAG: hypothetical protein LBR16_06450 [Treponema sp.]|jgi:glycosidase|nr:hypothetical protein [Treponema sp.]
MAYHTDPSLRGMCIYSVFVRNYCAEGTFRALEADLDRIQRLGADAVWLLPIYPVGVKNRKGQAGSPYAIADYRAVNPDYGTLGDFRSLVDAMHTRGLKCIIDIVYNHTSPDSVLAAQHPEWFFHKADGSFGNRIGDWSDVIDLDYRSKALWDYQIDTLKFWAGEMQVDGFRCDVAPLIPLAFWQQAREAVEAVRPGCIWIAESIETSFLAANRGAGMLSHSDGELYQVFDMCYDYDAHPWFTGALSGKNTLEAYIEKINQQETIFPANYIKLRFLENHDQSRAAFIIPDEKALRNWTAFSFFQKGAALLYAGQEWRCEKRPSLFEKDPITRNADRDLSALIAALAALKKHPALCRSCCHSDALPNGILRTTHSSAVGKLCGVFSTRGLPALVPLEGIADGAYVNRIDRETYTVEGGRISCKGDPVILERRNT